MFFSSLTRVSATLLISIRFRGELTLKLKKIKKKKTYILVIPIDELIVRHLLEVGHARQMTIVIDAAGGRRQHGPGRESMIGDRGWRHVSPRYRGRLEFRGRHHGFVLGWRLLHRRRAHCAPIPSSSLCRWRLVNRQGGAS